MPPRSEVFRTPGYLARFVAAAFSTWGDYPARVSAASVLAQTGTPPVGSGGYLAAFHGEEFW